MVQVGKGSVYDGTLEIPVRAAAGSRDGEDVLVTVKSELTGQSVQVRVKQGVHARTCASETLGWDSLLYFVFIDHWVYILIIVLTVIGTKKLLVKPAAAPAKVAAPPATPAPKPKQDPLSQGYASPSSPYNATNADGRPYLFTVDSSPVYGSPNASRRKSPRSLVQEHYSY